MRLGIHTIFFEPAGGPAAIASTLAATARAADQGGVEVFTLMDHWFQMESVGVSEDPMLEGYTSLGYLAGLTERLRLGLLVTGVTYRHPGLLAKTVATLDLLSGGRAQLGIGAAWYEREHLGLGVPFPPLSERFERLEEAIEICHQMWSTEDGPFHGKHYSLAETICNPQPLSRIPVLIGGMGERKTLRMVAQHADACNLFSAGPDVVKHKLDVLREHCDALGRDYDSIDKTLTGGGDPIGATDDFLATMEAYSALGIGLVEVAPPKDVDAAAWVSELCERVLPRLASI